MATVVAIDANDDIETKYAEAFRRKYLYNHPKITTDRTHTLISCSGANANLKSVSPVLMSPLGVGFISGNGHGNPTDYCGQGKLPIWNALSVLAPHVSGKIVHLLSCEAGIALGPAMINAGARAFWGYQADYIFHFDSRYPGPIVDDPVAKAFLYIDTLIDSGILAGKDTGAINSTITCFFPLLLSAINSANLKNPQFVSANFSHNLCYLVGPFLPTYGDASATL